jgi:hypothetical protein
MVTGSYVIVLDGEIDPMCAVVFAPAEVRLQDGRTILSTAAIDQPALHGLLDRVAGLGLTLLSVTSADQPVDPHNVDPGDVRVELIPRATIDLED